jgi:hypothetical protein
LIKNRFKKSGVDISFEDIFELPKYVETLAPHIDPNLSNFARTADTQLQWRFEAVSRSTVFKNGAKTCYRAYCADKVTNIILFKFIILKKYNI